MRKYLRRYLPNRDTILSNRWLAPFATTLLHPACWHLNRHSTAGAVAVGLFCGLIPGPFQMFGSAILCVLFRVNLPVALVTTLYTNPFTIVPLYLAAYSIGRMIVNHGVPFIPPPEWGAESFSTWMSLFFDWTVSQGRPLAVGLLLLALGLAILGYLLVHLAWRTYLILMWKQRKARGKLSTHL